MDAGGFSWSLLTIVGPLLLAAVVLFMVANNAGWIERAFDAKTDPAGDLGVHAEHWDRAFDVMDNRLVPAVRPPRRPRPLTAWDRYLLGSPDFEVAEERGATAPFEPPRPAPPAT